MPETRQPVQPVEVDYTCDQCGEGKMRPTGEVLTSYPPKHPHCCDKCGARQTFTDVCYPHVTFKSRVDNPTDVMVVYRTLLRKYIAHVAAAEGNSFATDFTRLAPCHMGEDEFTVKELVALEEIEKEMLPNEDL